MKFKDELMWDFILNHNLENEFNKYVDKYNETHKGRFVKEPKYGEEHWWINEYGDIVSDTWDGSYHEDRYKFANTPLWKSYKDAERYLEINNYIKSMSSPFVESEDNYMLLVYYGEVCCKNCSHTRVNVDYFKSAEICAKIFDKFEQKDLKRYYFLVED